jgi:hypothetical protein
MGVFKAQYRIADPFDSREESPTGITIAVTGASWRKGKWDLPFFWFGAEKILAVDVAYVRHTDPSLHSLAHTHYSFEISGNFFLSGKILRQFNQGNLMKRVRSELTKTHKATRKLLDAMKKTEMGKDKVPAEVWWPHRLKEHALKLRKIRGVGFDDIAGNVVALYGVYAAFQKDALKKQQPNEPSRARFSLQSRDYRKIETNIRDTCRAYEEMLDMMWKEPVREIKPPTILSVLATKLRTLGGVKLAEPNM